ncbi:phospho-sugar mutase [Hydrogenibacillus sp. N12]|uniref:phospho-sugar mutase n=1 Tax=Hydrogenibacillus sp. N12 TaxID=2866627 RepID=UPI00207C10F7|nr:phospho-sugar mutase [Hydrogenibacillus sp. N12]
MDEALRDLSRRRYATWLAAPLSPEERSELEGLSEADVFDRFYRHLAFGTGGMRGELGLGTNRMNVYVVRRATAGLAAALREQVAGHRPRVIIAYDSRRGSRRFAEATAEVLAAFDVEALLFPEVTPTPELSFAVRALAADAGVVITASHNPPEYNGYKVYGPDGVQITPEVAERITAHMAAYDDVFRVPVRPLSEARAAGLVRDVGPEIEADYLARVAGLGFRAPDDPAKGALSIVYTPLHGAGGRPVLEALRRAGFARVHVVAAQKEPDGDFPTVAVPNPEEPEAFRLALAEARRLGADLVLATDPDVDRVGAAVRTADGEYVLLNGNAIGALLLDYLIAGRRARGTLPAGGAVIKTIVTGDLGKAIAEANGLRVYEVLTGFKFIGALIGALEREGVPFIFGYEESYGYLAGDFVRDKDAVQAAVLLAEAAAHHKAEGRTLVGALAALHQTYGAHAERLRSLTLKGAEGAARIGRMMAALRSAPPKALAGLPVVEIEDYRAGAVLDAAGRPLRKLALPQADVIKVRLEGGAWAAVRPSGTEPKIKVYVGAVAREREEAEARAEALAGALVERLEAVP